jgi:hypothetical protein
LLKNVRSTFGLSFAIFGWSRHSKLVLNPRNIVFDASTRVSSACSINRMPRRMFRIIGHSASNLAMSILLLPEQVGQPIQDEISHCFRFDLATPI